MFINIVKKNIYTSRGATLDMFWPMLFMLFWRCSTCFPGVLQSLTHQKLRNQQIQYTDVYRCIQYTVDISRLCMILLEPLNPHSLWPACCSWSMVSIPRCGGRPPQPRNPGQCLETWGTLALVFNCDLGEGLLKIALDLDDDVTWEGAGVVWQVDHREASWHTYVYI